MSRAMLPVDKDRIWLRLMQLAKIGRFGDTGVDRQALTDGDLAAKQWLIDWASARNFAVSIDAIGNVFVRRQGLCGHALPVVIGSHLDTEPTGGRFDGAYGVVAAMELLDALEEQSVATHHPVELVAWTNEEGCRFQPGCMGSKTHANPHLLANMLASRDANGLSTADALKRHQTALATIQSRSLGLPFAAFLEAHIEQGPVLEREGYAVAAVKGIQGRRVYQVDIAGKTAHAGTVPHALRCDALESAVVFLQQLYARAAEDDDIRITPGRLMMEPNSPSVVPGRVQLTIDIRHPDAAVLFGIPSWLASLGSSGASANIAITEIDATEPALFDAGLTEVARSTCLALSGLGRTVVSGASHDAHALAAFCPTAMVFVRCRDGVSHHEDEFASPEDLAVGASVLSACLLHAGGTASRRTSD